MEEAEPLGGPARLGRGRGAGVDERDAQLVVQRHLAAVGVDGVAVGVAVAAVRVVRGQLARALLALAVLAAAAAVHQAAGGRGQTEGGWQLARKRSIM